MAEREIYMKYYDENDKEIIIPDDVLNNEVGHGYCATIYRYSDDLCFKRYDRGITLDYNFLKTAIYKDLTNIDHINLVDIKKILYKDKKYKYTADAYLVSYYNEIYKDFLEVPTEYLLYNIEEIFKLMKKLSEYKIRIDDFKRENIILTENNIVLIDPDCWYYKFKDSDKEIEKDNINNTMAMFNQITENSLKNDYLDFLIENNLYYYVISSKLFPLTGSKDRAMKVLTKRLNGYKRPIDYVYSMKK